MSFDFIHAADIDEPLIRRDRTDYLENIYQKAPPAMWEIILICPDPFCNLLGIVEIHLHSLEEVFGKQITFGKAVPACYEKVYGACLVLIQKINLVAWFSKWTEANLFVSVCLRTNLSNNLKTPLSYVNNYT